MHEVQVGVARRAGPTRSDRCVPRPHSAWVARLPRSEWPGQESFRPPSSLTPPMACLIPGGPGLPLAIPGSLLYIFETSFYSL